MARAPPLLADDQAAMIGSFFLFEGKSAGVIAAFNRADPFGAAGIWKTARIHAFLERVDNR